MMLKFEVGDLIQHSDKSYYGHPFLILAAGIPYPELPTAICYRILDTSNGHMVHAYVKYIDERFVRTA